ncbi:tetratricopeptide repeat protein [Legionella massiliensis]|nr:tetratricopeptide repeat protein [Legionella massiliensis]
MGRSSLVLLCFMPFMFLGQETLAHPISKTVTIFGAEQGARLKIPKYSTNKYLLQVGSFDNYSNAEKYRNELSKLIANNTVRINTSNTIPVRYRVVIGPIQNEAQLISISHRLLARPSKLTKAQIRKAVWAKSTKPKAVTQKSKEHIGLTKSKQASKLNEKPPVKIVDQQPPPQSSKPQQLSRKKIPAFKPAQESFINSSLPTSTLHSEEKKEEHDWEKNLFLGSIEEVSRKQAGTNYKNKAPNLHYPLANDSSRDDQTVAAKTPPPLPEKTHFAESKNKSSVSEKPGRHGTEELNNQIASKFSGPLIQLAESETPIPLNLPNAQDSDTENRSKKITYYDDNRRQVEINLDQYEPKAFTLAFNVFLMNGNVNDALKIAVVAVENEPKNVEWRERLVEAALWSGNGELALEQWIFLIENNLNPEKYLYRALVLAKQVSDYDAQAIIYAYQLKKTPNNKELLLNNNIATQKRGYPDRALKMLQAIPNSQEDPQYLEQFIAITQGTDQPQQELGYLKKLISIDKSNTKAYLKEAEILYSRGDLNDAFNIYTEVAQKAEPTNLEFWKQYADLASITGHIQSTITALKILMKSNALDRTSAMELVELQELGNNLAAAYQDAKTIFNQNHDLSIGKLLLSLGAELNKWHEVKEVVDNLPPSDLAKLNNIPEYAILIATMNRQLGLVIESFQNWESILARWPEKTLVQDSFLWFLFDNNEFKQIEYVLSHWCEIFNAKPELWEAHAAILTAIGNNQLALQIVSPHWESINNDYASLLGVADLFIQNNNDYAAYYLQRRAMYLLLNEISPHPENLSTRQELALSELVKLFAPASVAYNVMLKMSEKLYSQPEVDEQIISWALETDNYDLSGLIIKSHALTGRFTPPWMSLTQALEENDRDLMQLLLLESPNQLPHRDRVIAATRIGNFKLAEEYAYQGLSEHPDEAEMYQLFTETTLPRANQFFVDQSIQTYGNVVGPLSELKGRFFVTPSLALTPYGIAWFPHSTKTSVIASPPAVDEIAGIIARKYVHRGWWEVNLAERKSLDHFFPASAKWHRDRIYPGLDAELSLGYHVKSDETTALLLGGMKNEAKLEFTYGRKSHDIYDAQLGVQRFLGQDGFYLGSGNELRLHWQHKWYLSYPDWNINFYGNLLNYKTKNRILPHLLQQLIPPNQDPTTAFYMPLSDINTGITFGFGQQYKEEYTHKWKPYAEAGLLYSRLLGLGQIVEGGVATSIFGRDHLVLHIEYAVNQQQVNQLINQPGQNQSQESQVYYKIGISYDRYF